jgi:antibiotic biosynthesis monooxygenase (ABM) superfamily enzyme
VYWWQMCGEINWGLRTKKATLAELLFIVFITYLVFYPFRGPVLKKLETFTEFRSAALVCFTHFGFLPRSARLAVKWRTSRLCDPMGSMRTMRGS